MSLIHQINGELLRSLSGGGSTAGRSSSTVNGKGVGATVASTASVQEGISKAASAFGRSYQRLGSVIQDVLSLQARLEELSLKGEALLEIAERASGGEISEGERARLNSRFQVEVEKFRNIRQELRPLQSDDAELNLFLKGDFVALLRFAGIDPEGTNRASESIRRLGGRDSEVGYERVLSTDITVVSPGGAEFLPALAGKVDPLQQNLQTQAGALRAANDLREMLRSVRDDSKFMRVIADEITGAFQFAYIGQAVFKNYTGAVGSAESLAENIVKEIRQASQGITYNDLDRELIKELFGT